MALWGKKYFKHSTRAHRNSRLCRFMDDFCKDGYFYYFILLELCGQQAEDSNQITFSFHYNTLAKEWKTSTARVLKITAYMEAAELIKIEGSEKKENWEANIISFTLVNII